MSARLLFISDLHLEASRPDITRTLLQFLADNRGNCTALYILGDLFEVWIGDDDPSPLAAAVAQALHQFSAAGPQVYLMHGNRDFLLGTDFANRCGAKLLNGPYTLASPAGSTLLLLHGDSLCTDDIDYQQFRLLVRTPHWQQEFLAQSLAARHAFAAKARAQSKSATANKHMDIMDVNSQTVLEILQSNAPVTLLHGHTHRPAIHYIDVAAGAGGARSAQRIVLGAWDTEPWYAESDGAGIRLQKLALLDA
ncbi:MAG: UDP-2,3-diacylglucosamine diphosphatase [Gammaproteobacteria bacterium]|nr:UDP-2,3-diacylglucosamine diphosphatase [Gammaproteobacteria bacterium]